MGSLRRIYVFGVLLGCVCGSIGMIVGVKSTIPDFPLYYLIFGAMMVFIMGICCHTVLEAAFAGFLVGVVSASTSVLTLFFAGGLQSSPFSELVTILVYGVLVPALACMLICILGFAVRTLVKYLFGGTNISAPV